MDRTVREVLGVRGKRVARIDHLVAELAEPGAPSFHDLLAFGFGGRSAPSCVDENEIRHFLRSFCEWCPDLRAHLTRRTGPWIFDINLASSRRSSSPGRQAENGEASRLRAQDALSQAEKRGVQSRRT